MKNKTVRAVAPSMRTANGKQVLDVTTWKFIVRECELLSTLEFFIIESHERIGWECGRIVFCGKLQFDDAVINVTQDDIEAYKERMRRKHLTSAGK